jgi:chromate transporter
MKRVLNIFRKKRTIGYWELFVIFFKAGSVAFGGGYIILSILEREMVNKRRLFTEKELVNIFTISQALPGAIAVNSSFYVGYERKGLLGGIIAVVGIVLPAFISIVLVYLFFMGIRDSIYVKNFLKGVITASSALILVTAINISRNVLKKKSILKIAFALVTFIGVAVFDVNSLWFLLCGIVYGLLRGFFFRIPPEEPIKGMK